MAIKYNVTKYKFDTDKELSVSQGLKLCEYAVEYLKRFVDLSKASFIKRYFWANSWTIRVDLERKVLGFKRTKSYHFSLYDDKVELIEPNQIPNELSYSVKKVITQSLSQYKTFLEFVAEKLEGKAEEYGIKQVEEEYERLPD